MLKTGRDDQISRVRKYLAGFFAKTRLGKSKAMQGLRLMFNREEDSEESE